MIRVVLDTNVVVSALLSSEGIPAAILDLVLQKRVVAGASRPMFDELEEVLRRPKFDFSARKIGGFLAFYKSRVRWIAPARTLALCPNDPSDDRFLECALAVKAEFLITGDKSDFPRRFRVTRIVSPAEFWEEYLLRAGF